MTTTTSTSRQHDLAAARARNESTWRTAATALLAGDVDEFLTHWTDDARYALAYPVDGLPSVVEGPENLRGLFTAMTSAAEHIGVDDVTFHQTDDPDVAIIEERMTAELVGGGHYVNRLIMRVVFRENKIHDMLEYFGQSAQAALLEQIGGAR